LVLIWSPRAVQKPPPSSLQTLYPCEVTVPPVLEMLGTDVFRMLFPISNVPVTEMPPPSLPLIVLFVIVPPRSIPPPDKLA